MDSGNFDRIAKPQRIKLVDLRVHAARAVALVDSQNDGLFGLFEHRCDLAVSSGQSDRHVHDHNDNRRGLDRDLSLTAHEFQHLAVCARLNAAGIDEREAPSVPVAFAIDPVARHARRVLDNRHALAGQFIEEHRFADIRPAHDCHNRFCHRFSPFHRKPTRVCRGGRLCPPGRINVRNAKMPANSRRFWADRVVRPYGVFTIHFPCKRNRGRLCTTSLSFSYRANLLSFNRNDFTAIVIAASLAGSVRQAGLAALGASDNARDRQFPVGAASLISSRAGYFSLGYCHLVHLLG